MNDSATGLHPYLDKALSVLGAIGRPMSLVEIETMGINRMTVSQLVSEGYLERPVRGVYHVPGEQDDQRVFWACVSLGYDAVFCLRSAASFHGLTEEGAGIPDIAVSNRARVPIRSSFEIRVRPHRWPEAALSADVDTVLIQSVPVRITSPARTVVDMFRHSEINDEPGFPKVVEETSFVDCLTRYLSRFEGDAGTAALRRVAQDHGCWDQIRRIAAVIQHTTSALVPR